MGFRVWGLGFRVWGLGSLTLTGLIFSGFWAQRPHIVRLLGDFDAKGRAAGLGERIGVHSGFNGCE